MPPTKTWKSIERRVADLFDTVRNPLSGGNSGHTRSDTREKFIFSEVKYKQRHSVLTLFRQTAELAKKEIAPDGKPKLPVVALCEKGDGETFLLMRASDMETLFSRLKETKRRIIKTARLLGGKNGGDTE